MTARLRVAALTHQGAVRPNNEDCILVDSWLRYKPMARPETFEFDVGAGKVLLVADGMGGHAAGEVASVAVAKHLRDYARRATSEQAIRDLIADAHRDLIRLMSEQPNLDGMGTTVAGIAFGADGGLVFNVGDSRVYELRAHRLTQLSTDDTPGPKLADGRTAQMKSAMLLQVLGGDAGAPDVAAHLLETSVDPGAGWLLCSDGLTDMVQPPDIAALIDGDEVASVERMFEAAMRAGGADNISIILVRVV